MADGGSSGATSGGSSGSGTGGASSGTSGGTTGSAQPTCTIPDAGTVPVNTIDPSNPCQVCTPSASTTTWSTEAVCFACQGNGISGLCTTQGTCCTTRCDGSGQCKLSDGGLDAQTPCQADSDCCGIVNGCP